MFTRNKDLTDLNTFGLSCYSASFFSFTTEEELITLIRSGKISSDRTLVLGGGSNILFRGDFDGTIIHPETTGIFIENSTSGYADVRVAAGVIWDNFVEWAVDQGLGGIENLSYIPGQVGAAPVQNIGAYGCEAKDTLLRVRCVDIGNGSVFELSSDECEAGYRDSIFKNRLKGKCVVTDVWFRLLKRAEINIGYPDVEEEYVKSGSQGIAGVRDAIISIRKRKLPDPAVTGNAGSFFRNPVISASFFSEVQKRYPSIPHFILTDGSVKLAAAWLIDQCGWKGKWHGNAGVHPRQALVLINNGHATGREIVELSEMITHSVQEQFGIELVPEAEII